MYDTSDTFLKLHVNSVFLPLSSGSHSLFLLLLVRYASGTFLKCVFFGVLILFIIYFQFEGHFIKT